MKFVEQDITIQTWKTPLTIKAMVCEGTGLAYHLATYDSEESGPEYTITHLASGLNVSLVPNVPVRPEIAQMWVERIAPLTNWNTEGSAFTHDMILYEKVVGALASIEKEQGICLDDELEAALREREQARRNLFIRTMRQLKPLATILAELTREYSRYWWNHITAMEVHPSDDGSYVLNITYIDQAYSITASPPDANNKRWSLVCWSSEDIAGYCGVAEEVNA